MLFTRNRKPSGIFIEKYIKHTSFIQNMYQKYVTRFRKGNRGASEDYFDHRIKILTHKLKMLKAKVNGGYRPKENELDVEELTAVIESYKEEKAGTLIPFEEIERARSRSF